MEYKLGAEDPEFHADRIVIMKAIERLALRVMEQAKDDGQVDRLHDACRDIISMSGWMLKTLYDDAEYHGVSAKEVGQTLILQTLPSSSCPN
jgi:hypothetical protein